MTNEPIVAGVGDGIAADGATFSVHEWAHGPNAGPELHVHLRDDEAWHVLEGSLRFRFADRTFDATAGTTVFAPAGTPHTYGNPGPGEARYLIVLTPRIQELIDALHAAGYPSGDELAAVYRKYDSDVLE
jgi:mannose-6-phosphate isomerase-like protein (cupin superfamily)